MEVRIKKYICICGIIIITLLFGACSCSTSNTTSNTTSKREDEKVESTNNYDIGITNLHRYDENVTLDKLNQVTLKTEVKEGAKIDDSSIIDLLVLASDETSIVVQYQMITDKQNNADEEIVDEQYEFHLVCLDKKSKAIKKEHIFTDAFAEIKPMNNSIIIERYNDKNQVIESYDMDLQLIGSLTLPIDKSGHITTDGKRYYYIDKYMLCCYDVETQKTVYSEKHDKFLPEYIVGVLTVDGHDYAIMNGKAQDYKQYQVIYDITNNQIVRTTEEMNSEVVDDLYVETYFEDMGVEYWLVGQSKDVAYEYKCDKRNTDANMYVIDSSKLLFADSLDKTVKLTIYDQDNSQYMCSTTIDLSKYVLELPDDYFEEEGEGDEVYIYGKPIYLETDKLLIQFIDRIGNRYYAVWSINENATDKEADFISAKAHQMGTIPTVDISSLEGELLYPGELGEELVPLKEIADKMEQKYDVEIYIGEECANIMGGYAVHPLTDYDLVKRALEVLQEEMDKYPDKFFSQFDYSWRDGLSIYIASELIGIEDGVLDIASGFQMEEGSESILVIDCNNECSMGTTFHHELCHAIEDKIIYSEDEIGKVLDSDKWVSMNTCGDIYSYSYENWYKEEYEDFRYDVAISYNGDVSKTCFVDGYSMTYPSEDRARIFESVMYGYYEADFDVAPMLREKLNYYAQCIRAVFDTTGWVDVRWEAYMD